MNPRGISIAGFLGILMVIALGLAALKSASVLWTNAASNLVLALLLMAIVGAVFLRGPDRAYWAGFAVFGWLYLFLVNGSGLAGQFSHDLTSGLEEIAERMVPFNLAPANVPMANRVNLMAQRSVKIGNFVQIGRLLLILLFAFVGGLTARAFAIKTERAARETVTQPGREADR